MILPRGRALNSRETEQNLLLKRGFPPGRGGGASRPFFLYAHHSPSMTTYILLPALSSTVARHALSSTSSIAETEFPRMTYGRQRRCNRAVRGFTARRTLLAYQPELQWLPGRAPALHPDSRPQHSTSPIAIDS